MLNITKIDQKTNVRQIIILMSSNAMEIFQLIKSKGNDILKMNLFDII
jgi:hypothetical protein